MFCPLKHKSVLFAEAQGCAVFYQTMCTGPPGSRGEHAAGAEFALATLHQYQPFEQYIILDVRLAGGRSKYVD